MVRLLLSRHSGYELYLQRQARKVKVGSPADEQAHPGGGHEPQAVAHSAADQPDARCSAALGSGLSVSPALDAAADDGVAEHSLSSRTGGRS